MSARSAPTASSTCSSTSAPIAAAASSPARSAQRPSAAPESASRGTLRAVVVENVARGSVVSTDELISYGLLTGDGFIHGSVKHGAKEWSYYDYRTGETHSTNSIESFWKLFKYSVRSTHIHISGEKMPKYLAEFAFRSNHRQFGNGMFDLLLARV
jgi:transposase